MHLDRSRLKRIRLLAANPKVVARTIGDGLWNTARECRRMAQHLGMVTLSPSGPERGRVLLSYILDALFRDPAETPTALPAYYHASSCHTRQMANTFVDFGYRVDVISQHDQHFVPPGSYDVVVGTRFSLERLSGLVPGNPLRILHLETAGTFYHSIAEMQRLAALYRRRGEAVQPNRFERPHRALECADFCTLTGNLHTLSTYESVRVPIYLVPVFPPFTYPWPEAKDFASSSRHFLWMASEGAVHKGLDVTLEAFAGMPDLELTVCGRLTGERDFCRAYDWELWHAPNIHTRGWIDIGSPEFTSLANRAIAHVHPSCSEGQSGAVLIAMHAGLIPVASVQSGVDMGDFGVTLQTSSVDEIRWRVGELAAVPARTLAERARDAYEFARRHNTFESFASVYREAIRAMLVSRGLPASVQETASDTRSAVRNA
jgi:hypothetical protein